MRLPKPYVDRMRAILGDEYDAYERSMDEPIKRGLTVNTLKTTANEVQSSDLPVENSGFDRDSLILTRSGKIGITPWHHGGAFYVQEPGAMLPVVALDLDGGDRVLDLCAAPGGKTVQAALRAGEVLSNEVNADRARILASNVERTGLRNVVVINLFPSELSRYYEEYFDVVIVDAPCSGEGMFRKEPDAVTQWSEENVEGCAVRQRGILADAHKMLRGGGKLLYSTCTFSVEENERNVAFMAKEYGYELLAPKGSVMAYSHEGVPCQGVDATSARRVYPHGGVGEGQFFAVLRKPQSGEREKKEIKTKSADRRVRREFAEFCKKYTIFDDKIVQSAVYVAKKGKGRAASEKVILPSFVLPDKLPPYAVVKAGIELGEITAGRFVPAHNLFTAFGEMVMTKVDVEGDDAARYLHGDEIDATGSGWACVTFRSIPLGGGKITDGKLKNHYPKGLRNNKVEINYFDV